MKKKNWNWITGNASAILPRTISAKIKPFTLFALLTLSIASGTSVESASAATSVTPTYEIAFASLGPINSELFIADADGNNAKPLLPHAGFDGNGSFSRDGKWIVFTSEREGSFDIYRTHPDGSGLERLVDNPAYDDQAAFSPDGTSLAFVSTRSGQADIWIMELATKQLRNLTNHPGGDFRPAWSPDGQWLAFTSDRDSSKPRPSFFLLQSTEIYLIHPDGTELQRVAHGQAFTGSPAWSQDGKQLVFYQADVAEVGKIGAIARPRATTQIVTIDLATNEQRSLTSGAGEKWSPRYLSKERIGYASGGPDGGLEFIGDTPGARGEINVPNWAPDWQRMVFHRDVENQWPPVQTWHSNDARFRLRRTGMFPSYDPASERLLSNGGRAAGRDILSMRTDGSQRSIFLAGGEKSALAPIWSPTGDRVAFALGGFFQMGLSAPAAADIAIVNRDGTGLKILTDGTANLGFPSWSPDGTQIVYRAAGKNNEGLFVMTLATGAVRALIPVSGRDNFPAWSPKGDRIAFTRLLDGNYELYTVNADGSDLRRLTTTPGNDAHCAWSPDGEWLAFSSERGGFKDEAALYPGNAQPYADIYIMRADGSDVRQLTDTPFEEGSVGWAPLRR